MSLKDLFSRQDEPVAQDFAPVKAVSDPAFVAAPVTGAVIERMDVESAVFADGLLGRGCGIKPQEDVLYAPVTGTVTVTYPGSRHAVGFVGEGGVQVVVHVGLGTAALQGKGFAYLVSQGDHVEAGQPVLTFDRQAVRDAGLDDIVLVAVPNAPDFADVELKAHGHVDAGEPLLQVLER